MFFGDSEGCKINDNYYNPIVLYRYIVNLIQYTEHMFNPIYALRATYIGYR